MPSRAFFEPGESKTHDGPAGLRLAFLGILELQIKAVEIEQYAKADLLDVTLFKEYSGCQIKKARHLAQAA